MSRVSKLRLLPKTSLFGEASNEFTRTPSNVADAVHALEDEKSIDDALIYLTRKHPFYPEKFYYQPVVRKCVQTGIDSTTTTVGFWKQAAKASHQNATSFLKNVIPSLSTNELNTMRRCIAVIKEKNTARATMHMEYCKEILNQIVLPGKKLVKHINDAVRLHDGEINVLIEKYTRKEKTIKKLADAVNSCAKQVDHVKNALLEHRIKLAKQYPDFVNNPANGHESIRAGDESLLQKGFLRKKGSGTGYTGRRNWKERLFTIEPRSRTIETRHCLLKWFEPDNRLPIGSFLVDSTTTVTPIHDATGKYTFAFVLETKTPYYEQFDSKGGGNGSSKPSLKDRMKTLKLPRSKPKQRSSLMLQASLESDRKHWMEVLKLAITSGAQVVMQENLKQGWDMASLKDNKTVELDNQLVAATSTYDASFADLKAAESSLAAYKSEHKAGVSLGVRKLLRVERYRLSRQKQLMGMYFQKEADFEKNIYAISSDDVSLIQNTCPDADLEYLIYNYIGCPNPAENDGENTTSPVSSWRSISGNRKSVLSRNLMEKIQERERMKKKETPEPETSGKLEVDKAEREEDGPKTPPATKMAANRTRRRLSISNKRTVGKIVKHTTSPTKRVASKSVEDSRNRLSNGSKILRHSLKWKSTHPAFDSWENMLKNINSLASSDRANSVDDVFRSGLSTSWEREPASF
jgi:hypothetical protein